jgi:predicted alpha/beta superfamily hydrolase
MKKFVFSITLLFAAVFAVAQPVARVTDLSMKSQYFNHERQVLIYTPEGYDEYDATDFDVMYVFDSQDRSKFDFVHCALDLACPTSEDDSKRFIIVGICSTNLPDIDYYRNTDYLPMPIHESTKGKGLFKYEKGYGRSGDLKKFLKNELMPYIDKNYRTSGRTIGIGHSLSASFVLDCMVTDDLFDDYIAMSPNCYFDEFRVASGIEQYPFKSLTKPRFIYTSMANEIGSKRSDWGEDWTQGWQRVSTFLSNRSNFANGTIASVQTFPDYDHNPSFVPSLTEALREYLQFSTSLLQQYTSQETYPIHFELKGKDLKGDVYITGNQEALANWNPKGVKMKQQSDGTYVIDLQLHLPAYFKFTQGDWDHQLYMENAMPGNLVIYKPQPATRIYYPYED